MSRYALLLAPSANRVYADQAGRLSRPSWRLRAGARRGSSTDIDAAHVGGVDYLTFDGDTAAPRRRLPVQPVRGLRPLRAGGDDLLRPVELTRLARYDSDLITIPKYAGKTNEQFTKLLLNLTLLASASAPGCSTASSGVDPLPAAAPPSTRP